MIHKLKWSKKCIWFYNWRHILFWTSIRLDVWPFIPIWKTLSIQLSLTFCDPLAFLEIDSVVSCAVSTSKLNHTTSLSMEQLGQSQSGLSKHSWKLLYHTDKQILESHHGAELYLGEEHRNLLLNSVPLPPQPSGASFPMPSEFVPELEEKEAMSLIKDTHINEGLFKFPFRHLF